MAAANAWAHGYLSISKYLSWMFYVSNPPNNSFRHPQWYCIQAQKEFNSVTISFSLVGHLLCILFSTEETNFRADSPASVGVGVRVPIRVWFGSIRVSGFRDQRFQPHSGISKCSGSIQIFVGLVRVRITHLNDF